MTAFKPKADAEEMESDDAIRVMVEKGTDALRTSYSVQLSSTLNFKPCCMSLTQLREAVEIGKAVCIKAFEQMESNAAKGRANYSVTI